MSSGPQGREAVLEELRLGLRKMSTYGVLLSDTVAGLLGVHSTDMECADMLRWTGPVTAGQIADLTGLTTGAVTALIDRLERAEIVARERDPADKRRVIIRLTGVILPEAAALFASLNRTMDVVFAHYDDRDLAVILDFVQRATDASAREISILRAEANPRTTAE